MASSAVPVIGRCWFGHRWSRWMVIREGEIMDEEKSRVGFYLIQERTCTGCGLRERTMQRNRA